MFSLSLPFVVSFVQWAVACTLPTVVIRYTQGANRRRINLLDAATLAVAIPLLIVVPVWAFGLVPLRGEAWTAYQIGVFAGGGVSLFFRWLLRR
jgi:hypothetical protein